MAMEIEHDCPSCGDDRTFRRMASTTLHLGEKTKWYCTECDYSIVRVNGGIDSAAD